MILGFYRLKKAHSSPKIWSFEDCKKIHYLTIYFHIFKQFSSYFGLFFSQSHFLDSLVVEMTPRIQNNINMVICIKKIHQIGLSETGKIKIMKQIKLQRDLFWSFNGISEPNFWNFVTIFLYFLSHKHNGGAGGNWNS